MPTIAIVTSNALMGVGLQSILHDIIPFAMVEVCDFETLSQSAPEEHFHIFASANIVLERISFFEQRKAKTILLTSGSSHASILGEYVQIRISESAESIREQIKALHSTAHKHAEMGERVQHPDVLTPREVEVLRLLVDGMLNKEIAHSLNISLTTVISHRKNIVEKLGVRSLPGLTIYAVMKGYIEI